MICKHGMLMHLQKPLNEARNNAIRRLYSTSIWRATKRVALAKVLIEPADLLLLDEPTNHLDKESTDWLQDMLHEWKVLLFL